MKHSATKQLAIASSDADTAAPQSPNLETDQPTSRAPARKGMRLRAFAAASPDAAHPNPVSNSGRVIELPFTRGRREARKAAFIEALRLGLPIGATCTSIGIATRTAYSWREKDPAFAQAWNEARADGFDHLKLLILEAGKRDWRALDRYLSVHCAEWREPCRRCRHRELQRSRSRERPSHGTRS